MKPHRWNSRTRQELIIEVWEALDCESVGARELLAIQDALRESLGPGAVVSPAAIARVVADEGAVLRHPEVLNCDKKWRTKNMADSTASQQFDFSALVAAATSLKKIDDLRREAEAESNQQSLQRLRDLAKESKREAQLIARSKIVAEPDRAVATEIAEWLSIWLDQPDLFEDWLSLRQRSEEYRLRFES